MAQNKETVTEVEDDQTESFHEIEASNDLSPPPSRSLSMLIKITQPEERPLPVGVITERSIYSLVQKVAGVDPFGVTVMNDRDVMVEFHPKARMWEISALLHSLVTWDKYKVTVTCLMSSKPQLKVMAQDREQARRAEADFVRRRQQLEKEAEEAAEALQRRSRQIKTEEQETKLKIQDLLDKFEEQVKRIESCDSVPKPIDVSTPRDSDLQVTPTSPRHIFYKTPPLPKFSGTLPVPKGEGHKSNLFFRIVALERTTVKMPSKVV